jgi:hypothetical protein
MSTQKALTNLARSRVASHAVEKHCDPRWQRLLVETRSMARRLPSFQWLAARRACDGQEAGLVEPSLVIATTIQLRGAVDQRSYRAPRHWPGKN